MSHTTLKVVIIGAGWPHSRSVGMAAVSMVFANREPWRLFPAVGSRVVREGSGPDQITHNLRTVLIGADRKIIKIYSGSDWSTTAALDDLRAAVTHAAK